MAQNILHIVCVCCSGSISKGEYHPIKFPAKNLPTELIFKKNQFWASQEPGLNRDPLTQNLVAAFIGLTVSDRITGSTFPG